LLEKPALHARTWESQPKSSVPLSIFASSLIPP
jgi:hypothetical protein